MPSFVFWNVKKQSRLNLIRRLTESRKADFVMIAECKDGPAEIQEALEGIEGRAYRYVSEPKDKVKIFTTYDSDAVERQVTEVYPGRVSTLRVSLPEKAPFLLAAVHLKARWIGMDDDDL